MTSNDRVITDNVARVIERANVSENTPATVPVASYHSAVQIIPVRKDYIRVVADRSLLIDNMLYSHDGSMKRHTDDRWYFVSANSVVPTLAPKKKAALLDAITTAVNNFLETNPGYLDIIEILQRKAEIKRLKDAIESVKRNVTQYQNYLSQHSVEKARLEQELAKLLQDDDGTEAPSSEPVIVPVTGEVIEGSVISQKPE